MKKNGLIKFLNDSGFLLLASMLSKLASFIIIPIVSKYLTLNDYGTYDYYLTLTYFFIPIITLQIANGIIKYNFSVAEWKYLEKRIIVLIFILCALSTAILAGFIPSLYTLTLLFVLLYLKGITTIYDGILKVHNKVKFTPIGLVIESAFTILVVFLLRKQLTLNLVLEISIIGAALALVCNYIFSRKHQPEQEAGTGAMVNQKELLKKLVLFSIPLVPNSISIWMLRMSNRLVIVHYDGEAANAIFTVAFKYTTILTVMITAVNSAWLISLLQNEDEDTEQKMMSMNIHFYMLLSIGILMFAKWGIYYLAGNDQLLVAESYIPELVFANYLYAIMAVLQGFYIKKGNTRQLLFTTLLGGVINLVISILLYPYMSMYAVSIGMVVSYFAIILLRVRQHPLSAAINRELIVSCSIMCVLMFAIRFNWYSALIVSIGYATYVAFRYKPVIRKFLHARSLKKSI